MKIHQKIKYFLWLCHHNRLPFNFTLKNRGVPVDQCSKTCHYPCKDIIHVLWNNPYIAYLWNISWPGMPTIFLALFNPRAWETGRSYGILSITNLLTDASTWISLYPFSYGIFGNVEMTTTSIIPPITYFSSKLLHAEAIEFT